MLEIEQKQESLEVILTQLQRRMFESFLLVCLILSILFGASYAFMMARHWKPTIVFSVIVIEGWSLLFKVAPRIVNYLSSYYNKELEAICSGYSEASCSDWVVIRKLGAMVELFGFSASGIVNAWQCLLCSALRRSRLAELSQELTQKERISLCSQCSKLLRFILFRRYNEQARTWQAGIRRFLLMPSLDRTFIAFSVADFGCLECIAEVIVQMGTQDTLQTLESAIRSYYLPSDMFWQLLKRAISRLRERLEFETQQIRETDQLLRCAAPEQEKELLRASREPLNEDVSSSLQEATFEKKGAETD